MKHRDPVVPTGILVLGMHRSGTSAIARVLNMCGADLGKELLPAKADNERGFWENKVLVSLHEKLLAKWGLRWHNMGRLPDNWLHSASANRFRADLRAAVAQQFPASPLWLAKDPRLSLLAPLWIDALQASAIRPVFVVTIRHPNEVAASLAKRDGLSITQSHLLWLRHMLEAERTTRGHPRLFVHYDRLLADWRFELARIGQQLDVKWPVDVDTVAKKIGHFLAPSLRHHHVEHSLDADASPLPGILRQAYESACAAALDTSPISTGTFDAVAATFDTLMQMSAPLIQELTDRLEDERKQRTGEINVARAVIELKDREIAQARDKIDALMAQIDQERETHASRELLETTLRAELTGLRDSMGLKEQEIEAARRNIDALVNQIDGAREAHAARDVLEAALRTELITLRESIALKDREIDTARRNVDALIAQIDRARESHTARDAIEASLRAELTALSESMTKGNIDALVAQIDQAREAHSVHEAIEAVLRAELTALRETMARKDQEIQAARRNIDALLAEIDLARRNIDSLVAEIAQARSGLIQKDDEIDRARRNVNALISDIERARDAFAQKDAEVAQARTTINALVAASAQARAAITQKDSEIDEARRNIDALAAEIAYARDAHTSRDAELNALRQSLWFRLGQMLRVFGRTPR